jgi:hypothetical protein
MNGSSICPIFEKADLPGVMTVYADALHEGPVPYGLSDEQMREVRAATWQLHPNRGNRLLTAFASGMRHSRLFTGTTRLCFGSSTISSTSFS